MRGRIRVALAALAAVFVTACDFEDFGPGNRYREEYRQSFDMPPGGRLAVENANGSVEIRGWEQDKIEVSGVKYAATQDLLKAVRIEVSVVGGVAQVRTVRPSSSRGNYGVNYSIRLPRKTSLDRIVSTNGAIRVEDVEGQGRLSTTNGAIRVSRFLGPLDADTTNGAIELYSLEGAVTARTSNGAVRGENIRGNMQASTSNGSIEARIAEAGPPQLMRFSTSNGAIKLTFEQIKSSDIRAGTTNGTITLRLPPAVGARLNARTSNASISSDFDVKAKGGISRKRLEGVIGAGGPLIDLSSTNGAIKILRM